MKKSILSFGIILFVSLPLFTQAEETTVTEEGASTEAVAPPVEDAVNQPEEITAISPELVWSFDLGLSASLRWGLDFYTLASGFNNSWEIDFAWTVDKAREESNLPYGYVEIEGLTFSSLSGPGALILTPQYNPEEPFAVSGGIFTLDYGEVKAGIGYEDWSLAFYGMPDLVLNKSKLVSSVSAGLVSSRMSVSPLINGGFQLIYDTPQMVLDLGVASKYSWLNVPAIPGNDFALTWTDENDDVQYLPLPPSDPGSFANTDNEYAIDMDFLLYPSSTFFFELSGVASVSYTQPEFGGGFFLTNELQTSSLIIYLPILSADFIYDKDQNFGWEVGGGFRFRWDGTYEEEIENVVFGEEIEVFSGFTFGLAVSQYDFGSVLLDMTASIWEDSGDQGVLPIVGGGISWEGSNVTSINADIDDNMGFLSVLKTYIDLTLGGVQPYIGLDFSSQINRPDIGSDANDYQESLILYGGVVIPEVFPFLTLSLDYASGNLFTQEEPFGQLVFEAKVIIQ
jgi:hypothetical protein